MLALWVALWENAKAEPSCWEQWAQPRAAVEVTERPGRERVGLRMQFALREAGQIALVSIAPRDIVPSSDPPFSPTIHSGSWIELRDRADQTLFSRAVHDPFGEWLEGPGPGNTLVQVARCPPIGPIFSVEVPNDPRATALVLFAEPLDGQPSGPTREIARFVLP